MDSNNSSFFKITFYSSLCILLFWACAAQGKLTGGDEDIFPPKVRKEKSTPNFQTNFFPDKIKLEFDEFITLSNPLKEIAISPPLQKIPKFTARGKTLEITFPEDEKLKSDATYSINFGSAIKDLREGNVLKNYSYVFSTGDYLDSLSISGKVLDAFTKAPLEDVIVMLYDQLSDSIIYKERPFYFAKTSKKGTFNINNIKNDSFRIFALKDQNLNYILDQEGESLAFLDSLIILTDSSNTTFELELFDISFPPKIIETNVSPEGKVVLAFSQKIESMPELQFSKDLDYTSVIESDSLRIWYDTTGINTFQIYTLGDTLKVKPKKKKRKTPYSITIDKSKTTSQIVGSDSFKISFNYPIVRLEKDSIRLRDTSEILVDFAATVLKDRRTLAISSDFKKDIPYYLEIPDSTIFSYNGITHDSLDSRFTVLGPEKLGTINITFEDIPSDSRVVFILLDKEEELFKTVVNAEQNIVSIPNLIPKTYDFYLLEDTNGNGKWDTGDYSKKRQAEKITKSPLEKLRENWELSTTISLSILNFENNEAKGK